MPRPQPSNGEIMLNGFYELTECADINVESNFHSHNYLCGHAGGTVGDYVKAAVSHGLSVIGISDHCASPIGTREPYMTVDNLDKLYLPQFAAARRKYQKRISILAAAEIEYFPDYDEFYKRLASKLDYLVLGQHEYLLDGERRNSFCDGNSEADILAYFSCATAGLRAGLFSVFAHPDLIFYRKPKITERVVAAFDAAISVAVENNVAVELNANGIRYHDFRYPTDLLVELCKKYDAPVVVSSDCHSPDVVVDECVLRLYDYALKNKLNVVNSVRLLR